jgi:uncharacterized coiled-coil protein SlyX
MATPSENIEIFLERNAIAEGRRLEVAIVFAESMLRELGVAVVEWEQTARKLQRLKQEMTVPCPN